MDILQQTKIKFKLFVVIVTLINQTADFIQYRIFCLSADACHSENPFPKQKALWSCQDSCLLK